MRRDREDIMMICEFNVDTPKQQYQVPNALFFGYSIVKLSLDDNSLI